MDEKQMTKVLDFLFKRWNSRRFYKYSAINLFITKAGVIAAELFPLFESGVGLPFRIVDNNHVVDYVHCHNPNDNILKQLIDAAMKSNVEIGCAVLKLGSNAFIYKGETLEELLVKADLEDV